MSERPLPVTSLNKKVCLLGDFAVGKTSLVRRFVYDLFDDKYISTIGVKVSRKTLAIQRDDEIVELTLMLWDLAGSEEFDRVRASYLRGAAGAVLVCDLTRPETFGNLRRYAQESRTVRPGVDLILAANKRDLIEPSPPEGRPILDLEQVEAEAASLNASVYATSAKTGDEVEVLFHHLGRLLVDRRP
ncbi:MAG: Rab family GTPase [Anaerolineae bacterium]|jgi:small GTP-binding protein